MIRYNPKTWNLLLLFKGSIIRRLWVGMLLLTILTVVLCLLQIKYAIINIKMSSALPGYMGAALGLLLVFRNNTAYDKWWEARKILGSLVNVSRSMAITLTNILPADNQEKSDLVRLIQGFCFALKEHLRAGVILEELKMLNPADYEKISLAVNKPNAITNLMMGKISLLHHNGNLNDMQQFHLIGQVTEMVDILGKCERIRKTPIPIAYVFLLKFFIIIYVLIIPFGLIVSMGWSTIPLVLFIYYIMMSIVLTAEEIENPFGHDLNDLLVDEICKNIEANVEEISNTPSVRFNPSSSPND